LGWLEYLHLAAEHSRRGQMLQEVGLDSHPGCPVKPVDPLPAEGLALEGYLGRYDLVEDGDVVGKEKLQLIPAVVGLLDLALHQKLALHRRLLLSPWIIILLLWKSKAQRCPVLRISERSILCFHKP